MTPIVHKLRLALTRMPDASGGRQAALTLAWGLPLVALIAAAGGLIGWAPVRDPGVALRTAALLFLVPALGEELVFRGLLLPPPGEPAPLWRVAGAIALFILWHPLQAVTIGPPWATLFLDPWFLTATAALGLLLTRLYLATGSLWPAVATHWAVVAAWKLLFGGPFG